MNRRIPVLFTLLVAPAALSAQGRVRITDSMQLRVSIPAPTMLSAFPGAWRDSVVSAWVGNVSPEAVRALPPLTQGTTVMLTLQLMRSGDLRRARLRASTGVAALDSLLIATAWTADQALAYPKFPVGVEGAGTEVDLLFRIPITSTEPVAITGARTTQVPIPALSPACETAVAEPTSYQNTPLWGRVDAGPESAERIGWQGRALTSMQTAFRSPGRVRPAVRPRVMLEGPTVEVATMKPIGWLQVRVDAAGRLRDRTLLTSTGYPALDTALVGMVDGADSAGLIPPPPAGTDSATIDLVFELRRITSPGGVPLGEIAVGKWSVDVEPHLIRPGVMRYPEQLKTSGIGGRVTASFIIDTTGRAIPASIDITSSPHPGFSEVSAELILGSRYRPAQLRTCAVPVIVRQSITFRP